MTSLSDMQIQAIEEGREDEFSAFLSSISSFTCFCGKNQVQAPNSLCEPCEKIEAEYYHENHE